MSCRKKFGKISNFWVDFTWSGDWWAHEGSNFVDDWSNVSWIELFTLWGDLFCELIKKWIINCSVTDWYTKKSHDFWHFVFFFFEIWKFHFIWEKILKLTIYRSWIQTFACEGKDFCQSNSQVVNSNCMHLIRCQYELSKLVVGRMERWLDKWNSCQ